MTGSDWKSGPGICYNGPSTAPNSSDKHRRVRITHPFGAKAENDLGRRDALMEELRQLHRAYPEDAAVRERLAKGLVNRFRRTNHTVGAMGAGPGFDGWLFPGEPRHRR